MGDEGGESGEVGAGDVDDKGVHRMKIVPEIVGRIQIRRLQMLGMLRIATVEGCEAHRVGILNVHFGHAVDVKCAVDHFTQSQLSARRVEHTVFTIADEN